MKKHEVRKALLSAGWQFVRRAHSRHEIWRHPDGRLQTISYGFLQDPRGGAWLRSLTRGRHKR